MADTAEGVIAQVADEREASASNSGEAESPLIIEVHDRQQIEVQLGHTLSGVKDEAFSLELYFFIPRNVGVTAANYPRDDFYGDLTTYLRVDLPNMTLEELAGGQESPLLRIKGQLNAIQRGQVLTHMLAVQVKLFGHTFTEAVRHSYRHLHRKLQRLRRTHAEARWAYLDEVDRFAETARAALSALRAERRSFEPMGLAAPLALQVFHYTDEYCSVYFDETLAMLAEAALNQHALFDGSGFVPRLRQTLARHALLEAGYRLRKGFLNLADERGRDSEYFAFRQSFLKKAVQQALYVDTRRLPTDTFVRNATGVVAAGLAATWALVAQLPSQIQNLPPTVQTLLLGVPVVAYIAKDRIKELTREWLSRRVREYDNKSEIQVGSLSEAGLGTLAGRVQERVRFMDLQDVPGPVLALRMAHRTVIGASLGSEEVMLYRRLLEIHPSKPGAPSQDIGLREIIRVNLRHFLTRLDEPKQRESHYSVAADRFVLAELPKVYHLNLIARVRSGGRDQCLRWRIVLNKKGIVRLESV